MGNPLWLYLDMRLRRQLGRRSVALVWLFLSAALFFGLWLRDSLFVGLYAGCFLTLWPAYVLLTQWSALRAMRRGRALDEFLCSGMTPRAVVDSFVWCGFLYQARYALPVWLFACIHPGWLAYGPSIWLIFLALAYALPAGPLAIALTLTGLAAPALLPVIALLSRALAIQRLSQEGGGRGQRRSPRLAENPIQARESCRPASPARHLVWLIPLGWALMLQTFPQPGSFWLSDRALYVLLPLAFWVPGWRLVGAIAGEREARTWESLQTVNLDRSVFLRGWLQIGRRRVAALTLAALAVPVYLNFHPELRQPYWGYQGCPDSPSQAALLLGMTLAFLVVGRCGCVYALQASAGSQTRAQAGGRLLASFLGLCLSVMVAGPALLLLGRAAEAAGTTMLPGGSEDCTLLLAILTVCAASAWLRRRALLTGPWAAPRPTPPAYLAFSLAMGGCLGSALLPCVLLDGMGGCETEVVCLTVVTAWLSWQVLSPLRPCSEGRTTWTLFAGYGLCLLALVGGLATLLDADEAPASAGLALVLILLLLPVVRRFRVEPAGYPTSARRLVALLAVCFAWLGLCRWTVPTLDHPAEWERIVHLPPPAETGAFFAEDALRRAVRHPDQWQDDLHQAALGYLQEAVRTGRESADSRIACLLACRSYPEANAVLDSLSSWSDAELKGDAPFQAQALKATRERIEAWFRDYSDALYGQALRVRTRHTLMGRQRYAEIQRFERYLRCRGLANSLSKDPWGDCGEELLYHYQKDVFTLDHLLTRVAPSRGNGSSPSP